MCRITKKADGSNGRDYVPLSSFGYVIDQDAINKLGRLEDFEEALGKDFEEYLEGDTLYQHCKKLEQKLHLLERENKALAKEGEEKCEKLERLEKALVKATPKKPVNGAKLTYIPVCPNCDSCLISEKKYCDRCGQAIDWSEEE